MRMDVTVLGKFTLNLTTIPASNKPDETDNFAACFYRAFRQLLTMVYIYTYNYFNYFVCLFICIINCTHQNRATCSD